MISLTKKDKQVLVVLFFILTIVVLKNSKHDTLTKRMREENDEELASRTRFLCASRQPDQAFAFAHTRVINTFNFSFPINVENACERDDVEFVMPIHSALSNFERREQTRRISQGQYAQKKSNRVVLLFFVGLPDGRTFESVELQRRLNNESTQYGDIVQIDVDDTYSNIIYKSIAVLQWILTYCDKADYVIKTDDDVLVIVHRMILSLYKARHEHKEFIIGDMQTDTRPKRSRSIKRYMPVGDFRNATYPPFVASPAMGYPISTALLLYHQALRIKLVRLHDVFLTGICAQKLGIPVIHDKHYSFVHRLMTNNSSNNIFNK